MQFHDYTDCNGIKVRAAKITARDANDFCPTTKCIGLTVIETDLDSIKEDDYIVFTGYADTAYIVSHDSFETNYNSITK